ncbi:hypothetical protein BpHYR1_048455 [Brachionus plicatilis]|uniref:Uncharacterized protein n=1 Tax=Brachionus plicatilis TaxID=10195 RepID=A0A3M7Q0N2_BRAPC|nr:hypothetical protein BpHYR1_048455 [Brachionus plicatilis]
MVLNQVAIFITKSKKDTSLYMSHVVYVKRSYNRFFDIRKYDKKNSKKINLSSSQKDKIGNKSI